MRWQSADHRARIWHRWLVADGQSFYKLVSFPILDSRETVWNHRNPRLASRDSFGPVDIVRRLFASASLGYRQAVAAVYLGRKCRFEEHTQWTVPVCWPNGRVPEVFDTKLPGKDKVSIKWWLKMATKLTLSLRQTLIVRSCDAV